MIKFTALFAAAAALAAPAMAETLHFKRDGVAYVADVRDEAGVRYITGRQLTGDKRSFALKVVNGQVTGTIDYLPVSYPVPAPAKVVTASLF